MGYLKGKNCFQKILKYFIQVWKLQAQPHLPCREKRYMVFKKYSDIVYTQNREWMCLKQYLDIEI